MWVKPRKLKVSGLPSPLRSRRFGRQRDTSFQRPGLGQNGWGEGYNGNYGLGAALLTEFLATLHHRYPGRHQSDRDARGRRAHYRADPVRPALPLHQRHGAIGQPGAQPWPGGIRRRQGTRPSLAVPDRTKLRRCSGGLAVPQSGAGALKSLRQCSDQQRAPEVARDDAGGMVFAWLLGFFFLVPAS
jgi:hypothetical protein